MAKQNLPAISQSSAADVALQRIAKRRSFLKGIGIAGAALSAGALLTTVAGAEENSGSLTSGDAAILRFLAAAEIIESDLWLQYAELGGTQDNELGLLANSVNPPIPNYPIAPTGGSPVYTNALSQLDGDMDQYIHDNTEDEFTHENFINAYLASKGADTVNLDHFRTLPSSKATRSDPKRPYSGHRQYGRFPLCIHRAGRHQPLCVACSASDQSGGSADPAQHRRN